MLGVLHLPTLVRTPAFGLCAAALSVVGGTTIQGNRPMQDLVSWPSSGSLSVGCQYARSSAFLSSVPRKTASGR